MNLFVHFPDAEHHVSYRRLDYWVASLAFASVVLCFSIDAIAGKSLQNALGVAGWICLFLMLLRENNLIRAQVYVAVTFATVGEHFASIYMEGYIYRLQNIPAFVPPGHGIVYLTAVILGRTQFFIDHAKKIAIFVVVCGTLWAVTSLNHLFGRSDQIGTLLFTIYCIFLFKGRSPMVYLGAFFITNWVELIGTTLGTWYWAEIDPASTLTQGNPPSGVAAWYCLVDAVALTGAPALLKRAKLVPLKIKA